MNQPRNIVEIIQACIRHHRPTITPSPSALSSQSLPDAPLRRLRTIKTNLTRITSRKGAK